MRKRRQLKTGILLTTVIFALVIALTAAIALAALSGTNEQGASALKTNIERAVVECYALEGAYPAELFYIEEHYGISVNRDKYIVHYVYYGQNLKPSVTVIRRAG